MRINIVSPKINISDNFKDNVIPKAVKKLERFFEENADIQITVRENKNASGSSSGSMITIETIVTFKNLLFKSEQTAKSKTEALSLCIDKIIRQIRKNKTKVTKHLRTGAFDAPFEEEIIDDESIYKVIKTKELILRPMSADEAILQMNMLGYTFFMFKDAESGQTEVVYKRVDGQYSLLVPEK